jgi:branched-chain amino acid transport system permease protein
MTDFLQFLASGLTRGSIYGMVGIGFALIFRSSGVINFAQGEFVMLGGMGAAFLLSAGFPLPWAALLALLAVVAVGVLVQHGIVARMRKPSLLAVIIATVGVAMMLRGAAEALLGRQFFSLPSISGDAPIDILGAKLLPQSLWILACLVLVALALRQFFSRSMLGKAIQASASNRLAAELSGIDVPRILLVCFALSAGLGALAGLLIAPITLTQYDVGIALGMKGFCAAILGGLRNPLGSAWGGLLLGLAEGFAGGYLSSAYQDAVAFILIIGILLLFPNGLFERKAIQRV